MKQGIANDIEKMVTEKMRDLGLHEFRGDNRDQYASAQAKNVARSGMMIRNGMVPQNAYTKHI